MKTMKVKGKTQGWMALALALGLCSSANALDNAAARGLMQTPMVQLTEVQQQKVCANYMLWRAEQAGWVNAVLMSWQLSDPKDSTVVQQQKQAMVQQLMGRTKIKQKELENVLMTQMVEGGLTHVQVLAGGQIDVQTVNAGKVWMDLEFERLSAQQRKQYHQGCAMVVQELGQKNTQRIKSSGDAQVKTQYEGAMMSVFTGYPMKLTMEVAKQHEAMGKSMGLEAQKRALVRAFEISVMEYESMGYGQKEGVTKVQK